jgi:large subunit ribosomal protein L29
MKSKDEILNLLPGELGTKLTELQEEMENLMLQKASHQINNPLRIRSVRRDISRVRTLMSEYENGKRVSKAEVKK